MGGIKQNLPGAVLCQWEQLRSHLKAPTNRAQVVAVKQQSQVIKVLIRFVCNEAASVEFIGDIFEPTSCEYTIVVHTARFESKSQFGHEILLLPST